MTKIPNVDWEAITHPTNTRQDNMRAVQLQFGGSAPSGINDGRLSCGLSQVNPKRTILSPAAVKQLSALVDKGMTYQEAMAELQYRSSPAEDYNSVLAWAAEAMQTVCGVDRRFLEGDTEFIDEPPMDEHSYSYVLWGRLGLTYGPSLIEHSRGPEGESSSHCCHNGECTGRCQGA